MKRYLAVLLLACSGTSASADGLLSGYACGELPQTYRVDVEVADDSEQMLRIREAAIRAIARNNTEQSGAASLVLLIDMHAIRQGIRRKERDLGSVTDDSSDGIRARMNLWSNKSDSVIGGRKDVIIDGPLDEIRIDIAINDKSNGKCVWRGEAVHDTTDANQWIIAEKVVLRLINLIGRDIRDREFKAE